MLPTLDLADSSTVGRVRTLKQFLPNMDLARPVRKALELCRQLLSERGEVSGARLAGEALAAISELDGGLRDSFFDHLAIEFSPETTDVQRAAQAYLANPSEQQLAELQAATEPVRDELFRRLNLAHDGTKKLVDLRREILAGLGEHPQWAPISADLENLFTAWFNRGFLELRRIDWRTSAETLEKIIRYEAVHRVTGWEDLRRRLAADRRCYGFFHPAMPDEPVIFIEVALTRGMSNRVQPLLDPHSPVLEPGSADTAVFYSITNCQQGLRGVPFGSFLIKQVATDLTVEFPKLRQFVTLSPLPGFRSWLARTLPADARWSHLAPIVEDFSWAADPEQAAEMEKILVPLCAYYLLRAKQGSEPLDPVARFHLRNGSRLERINWMADTSEVGMERALGLMVNYRYRLDEIEANHEKYTREDRVVCSWNIEAAARRISR